MVIRVLMAVLAASIPAMVAAQEADDGFVAPNPLRNQNLVATCHDLSAQIRAADPQAMAALVGVWEGRDDPRRTRPLS